MRKYPPLIILIIIFACPVFAQNQEKKYLGSYGEAAKYDPEQAEAMKKLFELSEKRRQGEDVDPKEIEKAFMGSISQDEEKTFKRYIADPIPQEVQILEGSTISWLDTSAYLIFMTDSATFYDLAKNYAEIPRGLGKKVLIGLSSEFGKDFFKNPNLTFYRKITYHEKRDKKYRKVFYLARDESSGKNYFRYLSEGGIGKHQEFPDTGEEVIRILTGGKEVKRFIFGEYEAEVEKFDANGKLIAKWNIKNDKPVNRREFDDNGKLRNGLYEDFHENGKIKSEGQYQDGMRQGAFRNYYQNGALMSESEFRDFKKIGVEKVYHENGNIKIEMWWNDGQFVKRLVYDENGSLKNGVSKNYDQDGNLRSESSFKDGLLHGVSKTYFDLNTHGGFWIDGQMRSEDELKKENGKGVWERFYLNGKQVPEEEFKRAL